MTGFVDEQTSFFMKNKKGNINKEKGSITRNNLNQSKTKWLIKQSRKIQNNSLNFFSEYNDINALIKSVLLKV